MAKKKHRIEEFQTELVPIDQLVFLDKNANVMSSRMIAELGKEMEEFGLVHNVVVNRRNMNIVGGNHRVMVLQQQGESHVPVRFVDLDDKQQAKLALALNRIHGEFDDQKLKEIFAELDGDIDLTGFTDQEVMDLMDEERIIDQLPPSTEELNSHVHFQFGNIRGDVPKEVFENFESEINRIKQILYPTELPEQVSITRPLELLIANSAGIPTMSIS